jgi:hypothetical protein
MPNYELIAKFYTKHSPAQAHSSSKQPCDFRNQLYNKQQQPKQAVSYISCTASPTTHLFGLLDTQVAGMGKNQLVGLVRSCKLSTAAVHNGRFLQPKPAQTLAAIAVQLNAAASPAIFATDFLTDQQSIS